MDVNLRYPGGYNFSVALELYAVISPFVASGAVKFYPASASPSIVEEAKKQGLPAVTKGELEDIIYDMPLS